MKNVKKTKKIVGILLIFLIIIVIILIYIINKNNREKYFLKDADTSQIISKEVYRVKNRSDYFAISDCIDKYLEYLTMEPVGELEEEMQGGDDVIVPQYVAASMGIKTEEEKDKLIYSILDTAFIKNNNITIKNMYNFIEKREGALGFEAEQINVLEGEEVETYCVYGRIYEQATLATVDYAYYIVSVDRYKITFMIEPLKDIYNNIDEITIERRVDAIEENGFNDVFYNSITDYEMLLKYFKYYKANAINNPERQYNYLDTEYREKRFGTVEKYKEYVEEISEQLFTAQIKEYNVFNTSDEYTQYICKDQYGNYYIFKETFPMQYTLVLDTYTLALPEFTEKYDSANIQEKVILNIEKFKQAFNTKDYSYIYNKLADSFKNNKYKTEQEFEDYIKGALYNNIEIEYKNFSNQGETYIYNVEIRNSDNPEDQIINMQIIMQLKEERDFVMSFSIK